MKNGGLLLAVIIMAAILLLDRAIINSNLPDWWKWVLLK